jgi:RNase P subunit RPR2
MKSTSLKNEIFRVICANCRKPFHMTAQTKSEAPGEAEIAINCPYCQTLLMVRVPRRLVGTDLMFRTLDSNKQTEGVAE